MAPNSGVRNADIEIQMFFVISELMVAKDIGPDYWKAVSLLLVRLYQEISLNSMIHLSLSVMAYAKSQDWTFDDVVKAMDPSAHKIWMQALAIADEDFGLMPKE